MRRLVAPHREALAALARPDIRVEEGFGQPWPGLVDRLERVLDGMDILRDALLGTFDLHMARAAHRANDVMKTLTLLSAILLPAALVAGIMGMNFPLPMFDEPGQLLARPGVDGCSWPAPSSASPAGGAGSDPLLRQRPVAAEAKLVGCGDARPIAPPDHRHRHGVR